MLQLNMAHRVNKFGDISNREIVELCDARHSRKHLKLSKYIKIFNPCTDCPIKTQCNILFRGKKPHLALAVLIDNEV